jgi:hypothetical protein
MQGNLRTSCRAAQCTHGVPATKSIRSESISMLAVWVVTFTMLGVAEFADHFCDGAGLEVGLCCEVKPCVSISILMSVQKYRTRESHSHHCGKSDGFWVRPSIQMEDKNIDRSLAEGHRTLRQEKRLSEDSTGLRIQQVSVIDSDIRQEQPEEQIASGILYSGRSPGHRPVDR